MFARIAVFEGGTAEAIEAEPATVRSDVAARQRGEPAGQAPAELTDNTGCMVLLADPAAGRTAMILYCESEARPGRSTGSSRACRRPTLPSAAARRQGSTKS